MASKTKQNQRPAPPWAGYPGVEDITSEGGFCLFLGERPVRWRPGRPIPEEALVLALDQAVRVMPQEVRFRLLVKLGKV
jgi:hypothetical protein